MTAEDAFFRICGMIGARAPIWVQGAGGNVSRKHSGRLLIKASGCRLDRVGEAGTWVDCDDSALRSGILDGSISTEQDYAEAVAKMTRGKSAARASMETGFHSILPGEWVMHFHPILALLMAERPDWTRQRGIHVPEYLTPGLTLSRALAAHAQARVIVLRNHGVILQGSDPEELLAEWTRLEQDFLDSFQLKIAGMSSDVIGPLRVYFPDTAVFLDELKKALVSAGQGYRLGVVPSGDRGRAVEELWLATQQLAQLHPGLEEIAADEAARLAGLPLEQYRRQHGA